MQIGDKVLKIPETFGGWGEAIAGEQREKKSYVGRVCYIHPQGRYHTVEFSLPGGKVRECFFGV